LLKATVYSQNYNYQELQLLLRISTQLNSTQVYWKR